MTMQDLIEQCTPELARENSLAYFGLPERSIRRLKYCIGVPVELASQSMRLCGPFFS